MIYMKEGCALEQTSSVHQKLYIPYYIVNTCMVTSYVTCLLSRIKPADGSLLHSQYSLLRTRGVNGWVVMRINVNSDLFILNFCTHNIYMYTSVFLHV
jgi:hypothetical protein